MVFDRKAYMKEYVQKHKKKIKEYKKNWCNINFEKRRQKLKEYHKTREFKKSHIIYTWKALGLKLFGYTYDEVYEYYLDCDNCEVCNKDISMGGHQRNMDHCHDTGIFRWVLCNSCNTLDNWMNKI